MMDIIKRFRDEMRELTIEESKMIIHNFQDADLSRVKFLGNASMEIRSSDNICLESKSRCASNNKKVAVYLSSSNVFLESLKTDNLIKDVCVLAKYRCSDFFSIEFKYNCIGFAIGVMTYISSDDVVGNSPQEAITNFIDMQKGNFDPNYSFNMFKILHQLQYVENVSEPLKNNTIAFYFQNGTCKHAARYIIDFDFWISKLGGKIAIGHSLEDLKGGAYGDEIYYAEVSGDLNMDLSGMVL
jgi:hypothetical protein